MKKHSPNNPEKNASLEPQRQSETKQPSFVFAHEEALLLGYLDEVQQLFAEPAEEIDSWNDSIKTCMRNMEQDMNDLVTLAPDEESRYESALDVQSQYSRLLEISQEIAHSTGIFNQTQKKSIALLFSAFDALAQKVLETTFPEIVGQDPQKSFSELKQSLKEFTASSKPYQRLVSGLEKNIVAKKMNSWIRGLKGRYLDNVREFLLRHDIAGLTGNVAKLSAVLGIGLAAMDCAFVQKEIHDTADNPNLDGHDTAPKEPEGTDISVDYNERGEVFLRHGDLKLGLVRASKLGLLHDPNDTRSKSMELLISGFIFDRAEGVNYEIRDPEGFQSFVEQEAKDLIAKINSAGAQTPIEWPHLKEDEFVQLSLLIVQQNLTYDYLSTNYPDHVIDESALDEEAREQIAAARQEDAKISKMPLDDMLINHHPGVCRHYAALVAKVSQVLKRSSGSPYLNNINILPFKSNERKHAYNIVLEQHGEDTILAYFLDITNQKDKFALSEVDALSGGTVDYLSVEEFVNKPNVLSSLFSEEELNLALEKLLELNQTDLPKRQLWADILADRYYKEGIGEDNNEMTKKAEYYYKIAIDAYKEIVAYNKAQTARSQDDPSAFHRMYDIGTALTRYLALLQRKKNFDAAEEILSDNDLWKPYYFAPGIQNFGNRTGSREFNIESLISQLFSAGEYQRILDFEKKLTFNPGLSGQANILEAFLNLGKREEASQYAKNILGLTNILNERTPLRAVDILLEKFEGKSPWQSSLSFLEYETFVTDIWKFINTLQHWESDPDRDAPFKKQGTIDWLSQKQRILFKLFDLARTNDRGDASFFAAFLTASSETIDSLTLDGTLSEEELDSFEARMATAIRSSLEKQKNINTTGVEKQTLDPSILKKYPWNRLNANLTELLAYDRKILSPINENMSEVVSQGSLFHNDLPLLAIEVEMAQENRKEAFQIFEASFLKMAPSIQGHSASIIIGDLINRDDYKEGNTVDRPTAIGINVTDVKSLLDAMEHEKFDYYGIKRVFEVYAHTGRLLQLLDTTVETKGIPFIKKHFLNDIGAYFYRIYYSNRDGNKDQMAHLFSEAREYYEKGYPITNYFKIVLVEAYLDIGDWKTAESIWNTEYDKSPPAITVEDSERIPKEINKLKGKKK